MNDIHRRVTALKLDNTRACADMDPELFFPTTGESNGPGARKAKRACRECPLRIECLEVALAGGISTQHGIWGGTTPNQRVAILRRRRREAA